MRPAIAFVIVCAIIPMFSVLPAQADRLKCSNHDTPDIAIPACDEEIARKPNDARLYEWRGHAYLFREGYDRAIADYTRAINLDPQSPYYYHSRGIAHVLRKEYDLAIADYNKAIKLSTRDTFKSVMAGQYTDRGDAYVWKKDFDRAISDYNEAIRLGLVAVKGGDISFEAARAYVSRCVAFRFKGRYERAVADCSEAIRLDPSYALGYHRRGKVWEAKGERQKAIDDYTKVLSLPAPNQWERDDQADARRLLAALGVEPPPQGAIALRLDPSPPPSKLTTPPSQGVFSLKLSPPPSKLIAPPPKLASEVVPPPPPPSVQPGRRVALSMGNGTYRKVDPLPNPRKDASDIAAALKAAGFAEVVVLHDLSLKEMQRALAAFEEKAAGADWVVVYYGGHAIQVDGKNFLVPVDAELKSPADVEDETVVLDRVLARVAAAGKLRLVILDACRTNPFRRLWAGAKPNQPREVAERGLRRYETTQRNLLIAYAAAEGQAALDGPSGGNSPYVKALLKHLATPGLEINKLFRLVGDDVMQATGGKQQPFEYGSRSGEDLFFRAAGR